MSVSPEVDFFNSINLNTNSFANVIKKYKLWDSPNVYDKIARINAHNTDTSIKTSDLLKIYKSVYDNWYYYLENKDISNLNPTQQKQIKNFLSMGKYKKENMSASDCVDFVHSGYNALLKGCGVGSPMISQHDNYSPIEQDGTVDADFLHCFPFEYSGNTSCRLYLNVKPENIAELASKLLEKSRQQHRRVYFKFWTNDERSDPFLIYANYNTVEAFVDMLKEIRQENPKIFEGCQNINPFLTNIDGFIGFGEEPKYKHSSFNLERSEAIQEFRKEVVDEAVVQEFKNIGNYTGTIRNSQGRLLSIEDYLVYRLESSFKQTLMMRQHDIKQGKYPGNFEKNNTVHKYIEMENQIFEACNNELPQQVKLQIQAMAKKYREELKDGRNSRLPKIKFPTIDPELSQNYSVDYAKDCINRNGYIDYAIPIDINLKEKLFDVFGSEARIERVITDEALAPYLKKHHVSCSHPSLNIETEAVLRNNLHPTNSQ